MGDREPSRPEWPPLSLVTSTLLPDKRPSPSQPPPMLPELPRTSLRPEPSPLQPSQLPQHHTPPSHQLQETSDLPQLILSPRPESLPQSDPTPASHHRRPTSSPRSPSTSTTLTSPSPSPEPFPVRSSKRSTLPSLMRFPSQELSQFQPHTRFTQSKRLSRPPISTITLSRPTPPRLS